MFFRIRNLVHKELLQLTRDVMILTLILVGPVLQLALIARSTTQGFHHQPIVVVDQDHSTLSRRIVEALANTAELKVAAFLDSPEQIDPWLDRAQAIMVVTIPPGLEADLAHGTPQGASGSTRIRQRLRHELERTSNGGSRTPPAVDRSPFADKPRRTP